jgi:hypothetical protein
VVVTVSDEERELSELLQRAVPQLPAPTQRLERVRERVRQTRRRRAAIGSSVTALVVVAAAGLLLPGLGGASAGPAQRTQAQAAGGSPTPGAGHATNGPALPAYPQHTFDDLAGLTLRMPPHWYVLKQAEKNTDYVSTQQLALPSAGCDHALDDFCTPLLRKLHKGGTLLQLTIKADQGTADVSREQVRAVVKKNAVSACRTVGGTEQLEASYALPGQENSPWLLEATACLSWPTAAQQTQVRDVLMTADFS